MWAGRVVSLHIAKGEGEPMFDLAEAHAVPGRGVEGDRYFLGTGHFSDQFSMPGSLSSRAATGKFP